MTIRIPRLPSLSFTIEVDGIEAFDDTYDGDRIMMALRRGAFEAAKLIQGAWIDRAQALGLRNTGPGSYVGGIQSEARIEILSENMTFDPRPDERGQDVAWYEIVIGVTNTCPHAQIVEEGHAAFHLPSVVKWSGGKVKFTKDGRPYLNIPFGHTAYQDIAKRDTSGATAMALRMMLPKDIYKQAKKLNFVRPLRQGPFYDAQGRWKAKDRYHWPQGRRGRLDRRHVREGYYSDSGGELFEEMRGEQRVGRVGGRNLVNPAWQTSKYHGLFKAGAKGHSQYMTIRTMTPTSPGWNIPAMAGRYIAAQTSAVIANSDALQRRFTDGIAAVLTPGVMP